MNIHYNLKIGMGILVLMCLTTVIFTVYTSFGYSGSISTTQINSEFSIDWSLILTIAMFIVSVITLLLYVFEIRRNKKDNKEKK